MENKTTELQNVSDAVLDNIIVQQEIHMDNHPDSPLWYQWRAERNKAVAEWHRRRSITRYTRGEG